MVPPEAPPEPVPHTTATREAAVALTPEPRAVVEVVLAAAALDPGPGSDGSGTCVLALLAKMPACIAGAADLPAWPATLGVLSGAGGSGTEACVLAPPGTAGTVTVDLKEA